MIAGCYYRELLNIRANNFKEYFLVFMMKMYVFMFPNNQFKQSVLYSGLVNIKL